MFHSALPVCMLAAKCQAQIKEKSPSGSSYSSYTRTIGFPLPRFSVTGPLPLLLASSSSTVASSAPLFLATAPISRSARANSRIANFPRSSRTVRR